MKRLLFLLTLLFLLPPELNSQSSTLVTWTNVTVGTGSTVVSARTNRRFVMLQNYSDVVIYCKFSATAVVGEGIALNPQPSANQAGGSFLFDVSIPTGPLNCINGTGSKVVLLGEG